MGRRKVTTPCEVCGARPAFQQLKEGRFTQEWLCQQHGWPRRTLTYDILLPGDEVKVQGLPGVFKFLAIVESRAGEIHAELYGGTVGRHPQRMMRAVDPARLKVPSERVLTRQRRLRAERESEE